MTLYILFYDRVPFNVFFLKCLHDLYNKIMLTIKYTIWDDIIDTGTFILQ